MFEATKTKVTKNKNVFRKKLNQHSKVWKTKQRKLTGHKTKHTVNYRNKSWKFVNLATSGNTKGL